MLSKNPLSLTALFVCFVFLSGPVHGQDPDDISLFLRISGANSIDLGNVLLLPSSGPYLGEVIIRETVGDGTAILGDSAGLSGVDVEVKVTSGTGMFGGVNSGFGPGDQSSMDEISPGVFSTTSGLIGGLGFPLGPKPTTQVSPGVFEVVAGTFNIQFDGTPTVFSFADASAGAESFGVITNSQGFRNIDSLIDFSRTVMLTTAVPEPSSLAMVGIAALGMLRRRQR